jgi:hypothetical protein
LKSYKSPGIDQILAELIQAGGETLWSEIHKLINSIWNKEELPDKCGGVYYFTISQLTVVNGMGYHFYELHTKNFIEYPSLKVKSIYRLNYWESSMWVST